MKLPPLYFKKHFKISLAREVHRDRAPFGMGPNVNMPNWRGHNTAYSHQPLNIGLGHFSEEMSLRRFEVLMQKDAIMEFLRHLTTHRSRETSSNIQDEGLIGW